MDANLQIQKSKGRSHHSTKGYQYPSIDENADELPDEIVEPVLEMHTSLNKLIDITVVCLTEAEEVPADEVRTHWRDVKASHAKAVAALSSLKSDTIEVLDDFIAWLIDNASVRAEQNGRKTVRAHDFVASPAELEQSYIVSSRVKERIRGMGFNASSDVMDGLNTYITWKIDAACRRSTSR